MFLRLGAVASDDSPLQEVADWDQFAEKLLHSALIDRPTPGFMGALKQELQSQPRDTQLRWIELLRARLVRGRIGVHCRECGSPAPAAVALQECSSICKACSAELDLPSSWMTVGPLDEMRSRHSRSVPIGTPCRDFLEESFATLCSVSDRVTILDRYAISDGLKGDAGAPGASGLQRMADLASSGGVTRLEIIVSLGGKYAGARLSAADLVTKAQFLLRAYQRSMSVDVVVVSDAIGRRDLHDRWLGLSWGGHGSVSWSLGKGLGQFNGITTASTHAMARQDDGCVLSMVARLRAAATLTATF